MKVLVTGGNGYLGRHVITALLKAGHGVRSLVRTAPAQTVPGVEPLVADLTTTVDLKPAFADVDAVVHLAAAMDGDAAAMQRVNVEGTGHLLEAMASSTCRRIVHASSFSVYDWSRVGATLDEAMRSIPGNIRAMLSARRSKGSPIPPLFERSDISYVLRMVPA